MSYVSVYMTAATPEEADSLAQVLVEAKLAACVNIIPGATSVYVWKGLVEKAAEVVLIAKTREELIPKLTERVKAIHSYECPCIVTWPIQDGNPEYLKWIGESTSA